MLSIYKRQHASDPCDGQNSQFVRFIEHQVRQMIVNENFLIVRSKYLSLTRSRAEEFYAEHKGKFFYNRLVTYMSSGRCQPLILARGEAIAHWRQLMGPTKVCNAQRNRKLN